MRTLGQERAKFALQMITQARQRLGNDKESLKSLASGAPAIILQNGLGHTLSFFYAKAYKEGRLQNCAHKEILITLVNWLTRTIQEFSDITGNQQTMIETFIERLNTVDQMVYLTAQNEALKLLEWYKRYANSLFLLG